MSEEVRRDEILSAGPDDGDWTDVLRRAKRARRRQGIYGVVLLTALVAVGVASAYALGHPIVDFNTAEKGPTNVVNDFGALEVSAPENMTPGLLPDQARKIPGLYLDGKPYAFYIAPTKSGGFCSTVGECVGINDRPEIKDRILVGLETDKSSERLSGVFIEKNANRLVLSYADGTSEDVPFVWVTEPIEAGFFVLDIPEAHQTSANRPTALALYDSGGELLANESLGDPRALQEMLKQEMVNRSLPGYPHLSVPAEAIWSARRQLFDLRADDGARIGLWVAPKRGGGTCVWGSAGSGCNVAWNSARSGEHSLNIGRFAGGKHVVLGGKVESECRLGRGPFPGWRCEQDRAQRGLSPLADTIASLFAWAPPRAARRLRRRRPRDRQAEREHDRARLVPVRETEGLRLRRSDVPVAWTKQSRKIATLVGRIGRSRVKEPRSLSPVYTCGLRRNDRCWHRTGTFVSRLA